ncbi:MAG: hypothetical protein J6Y62_07080 [Clostridia bacterium]|nr:hypothetical protein [Clostridia bacterium]
MVELNFYKVSKKEPVSGQLESLLVVAKDKAEALTTHPDGSRMYSKGGRLCHKVDGAEVSAEDWTRDLSEVLVEDLHQKAVNYMRPSVLTVWRKK